MSNHQFSRAGLTVKVDLTIEEGSEIGHMLDAMRSRMTEKGLMPALFSDYDLLKQAIFAWNEKENKKKSR